MRPMVFLKQAVLQLPAKRQTLRLICQAVGQVV
jgi:hypothetical protein